MKRDLLLLLNC